MAEPEENEEDLFADLYDDDEATASTILPSPVVLDLPKTSTTQNEDTVGYGEEPEISITTGDEFLTGDGPPNDTNGNDNHMTDMFTHNEDTRHQSGRYSANVKEDGKMFIGGLNWETTDQSLNEYFSQFGEVAESTVMRESSGRSRGFGFLTFRDPHVVDAVMVKEHFLDGKIIDPKRAIPRDEQEKTAKIFVGGVSQEASETDFTSFFAQFGRVIDATLMMDKDTGRPRGFGFVTFDNESAVDRCLAYHPLEILGKPIEVKKAQPRGKMGEEEDTRGGRGRGKYGREDRYASDNNQSNQAQNSSGQGMMGATGMTPQMMAQYWQRMQQYFAMMQQQMAATAMGGGMGMNPQMMAQMQQMQQMQNMQKQMGGQSPNPQMQQQMMQMMQQQQQQQQQNGGGNGGMTGVPTGPSSNNTRSTFSAQEQQAFEQRKYEQQHAKASRGSSSTPIPQQQSGQAAGGPQSWEGMYDDVPQPNEGGRTSASGARTPQGAGGPGKVPKGPSNLAQPSGNAPLNAPTGPKNPGKPGGGGGGGGFRGGRGRYHPYGR